MWSSAILEELQYHEQDKLTRLGLPREEAGDRARHLVAEMRTAFDDAEVPGWEGLEGTFGLPDPGDEHVVAAAVVAGANVIITHNLRDFPRERLPPSLEVLPPHSFAYHTVSVDAGHAWRAVEQIVNRSGRHGPRLSADDVLDVLAARYGMEDAVHAMRQAPGELL